jgi:hypothetical protein
MRGIVLAVLALLMVLGLGMMAIQVSSVRTAAGESAAMGMGQAVTIAMSDEHLKAAMMGGVAAFAVGLVGLVVVAAAWRPRAKAAEAEMQAQSEGRPED